MTDFSPTALRLLADLADALSQPRGESRFCAPDRIPITSPNGVSYGTLIWDSQDCSYRWLSA